MQQRLCCSHQHHTLHTLHDLGIKVSGHHVGYGGGTTVSGEMVVKVVEASFAGVPYSIVGIERSWQNAKIPAEAVLESDNNIMIFRSNSGSGANISFYGKESGRYNIVARLGENGPVMAASQVCILDSSTHKADGYYKVIDTFDDGTKLIEGKIILSEVPTDLNIRIFRLFCRRYRSNQDTLLPTLSRRGAAGQ